MKRILLLAVFVASTVLAFAGGIFSGIDFKDAQEVKNGKVIIGIYDHKKRESDAETKQLDDINSNIAAVLKECWTYSEIVEVLPLNEAVKKASKDENLYVLFIGDPESYQNSRYYNPNLTDPSLLMTKGKSFPFLKFGLPYTVTGINKASVVYSVRSMQAQLEQILNKEVKDQKELYKLANQKCAELEGKTLYIPEEYLHPKVTAEVIKSYYPYNFKIVSTQEWKETIIAGSDNTAFLVYNLLDTGKAYAHMLYLVGANSSTYLGQYRMDSAFKFIFARKKPYKMKTKAFAKMKKELKL